MLLLDSDVIIDIQRGHPPVLAWFQGLADLPSIPGFVVMELIQDAANMRQVRQVLKLIAPLSVVWASVSDCNRALSDFSVFHLSHGLGLLDALIAACAVGLAGSLCTFNVKHYSVVAGLTLQEPYKR